MYQYLSIILLFVFLSPIFGLLKQDIYSIYTYHLWIKVSTYLPQNKKKKKKLRLHMNTNILSFNKCKLDTTWPINKCISRENICTLLSIISQKNIFNF